jgi:hypothetical protein
MKKKRKQYDDKFRASACLLLQAAGYPDIKGALTRTAKEVGIPARTLSRWFNGEQNPPPDQVVIEKRPELANLFESIAYKMLDHAGKPDVIEEMDGKAAVIAAATATDKMRLLRGLPTEVIEVIPGFVSALNALGKDPKDFMRRVIERADSYTTLQ